MRRKGGGLVPKIDKRWRRRRKVFFRKFTEKTQDSQKHHIEERRRSRSLPSLKRKLVKFKAPPKKGG